MDSSVLAVEIATTPGSYHASMKDWQKFWLWFEKPENYSFVDYRYYRLRYQRDREYWASQKRQKKRHGTSHFGGKGQEAVYKTIINQQPPHRQYVEPFGGMASVFRAKRSAEINLILELETATLQKLEKIISYEFECDSVGMTEQWCGLDFLDRLQAQHSEYNTRDTLIYCDPPYMLETRTSKTRYKNEMTLNDHRRFLQAVTHPEVKAKIQISHYPCELYDNLLQGWRKVPYKSIARNGKHREEMLYCNYEEPEFLHDSQYLGDNKRQREDIKRRVTRNISKLSKTEPNERLRILLGAWDELTEFERATLTKRGINSGFGHDNI